MTSFAIDGKGHNMVINELRVWMMWTYLGCYAGPVPVCRRHVNHGVGLVAVLGHVIGVNGVVLLLV